MKEMIDAYLAKDSLSIILEDRRGDDTRYHFPHPEMIITAENFADVAVDLYPRFLLTLPSRNFVWCREEITDAIACSLYLHYVGAMHQADMNDRETGIQ